MRKVVVTAGVIGVAKRRRSLGGLVKKRKYIVMAHHKRSKKKAKWRRCERLNGAVFLCLILEDAL